MTSPLPLEGLTSRAGVACGEAVAPARQTLTITVFGEPAPQGSKKGFAVNGRVVMTESSKRVRPWRQDVAAAARDVVTVAPHFPEKVPLRLDVVFTMRKPASAPKRRRTWPSVKPDGDKLLRAVCDALTHVAWHDDAQVIEYHVAKRYPGEGDGSLTTPGAHITITEVLA